MNIIPFKLEPTNDLLTSRSGLVCLAELMNSLNFSDIVNQHFPSPRSNRGFKLSTFVNALMLMLHDGAKCLEDVRHMRNDRALCRLLSIKTVPRVGTMGNWL
ncbi:MAG: hypothetical protein ACRBHB_14965 [Arenicella sp.]